MLLTGSLGVEMELGSRFVYVNLRILLGHAVEYIKINLEMDAYQHLCGI